MTLKTVGMTRVAWYLLIRKYILIYMLDLLVFGTVTIDLYYRGESITEDDGHFKLAIGGKYFADHFYEGLGGGGANVAIGSNNEGLKVGLVAKIGNNAFKDVILKKLDNSKVAYKNLSQFENDYINISSIILSKKGEKIILNYRTPHQHFFTKNKDYDVLDKAQAMYMANLSQVSLTNRIKIFQKAKSKGLKTFANINVKDCRRPIEELVHLVSDVDTLIINGYEFADMVKVPYQNIDFHTNIVKKYAPFTEKHILVITDGQKGSYAYNEGKVYYQKAIQTNNVVDTTGAGDAYTAGFISSFTKNEGIEKSMKNGAKCASKIVSKIGSN